MHLFRNPEIRRALWCLLAVTDVCTGAGFFVSAACAAAVLLTCVLLGTLFFLWTADRYRRIAALSVQLDRILHGDLSVDLAAAAEGELSILRDELHKMVVRLCEQTAISQAEHKRLADAIADISHQLRTPLTAMHIDLSLLQAGNISEEKRSKLIGEISMLVTRFDWLVEAMLKLSRIDADAVRFQMQPTEARSVVRRAAQPLEIPMELRGQTLLLEVPEGISLLCDPAWTAEAIGNVLKNCVEHMPSGGQLAVRALETALFTELVIEDEGTGFDPEDLPHLFERFYRGKNAAAQSAGIGLALSRTILAAQNGIIKAENRPEGGARFIIRLYKTIV